MKSGVLRLVFVSGVLAIAVFPSWGQERVFTGEGGTSLWSDQLNWSPLDVPDSFQESAVIGPGFIVEADEDVFVGDLSLSAESEVVIASSIRFVTRDSQITNDGMIRFTSSDQVGTALIFTQDLTLEVVEVTKTGPPEPLVWSNLKGSDYEGQAIHDGAEDSDRA